MTKDDHTGNFNAMLAMDFTPDRASRLYMPAYPIQGLHAPTPSYPSQGLYMIHAMVPFPIEGL